MLTNIDMCIRLWMLIAMPGPSPEAGIYAFRAGDSFRRVQIGP